MFKFKLTPDNTQFYDLFERSSVCIVDAATQFHGLLENFENPKENADEIKRIEQAADEITHDAMELLHASFITPLERSDIRRLAIGLDDIVDLIDDATSRISLYEVKEPIPGAARMANILEEASKAVRNAVHELRRLRQSKDIRRLCIEIKHWENLGDAAYHEAVAALFKSGHDALTVMKWKEILEDIEVALDRCEDVANVIEGIVLESA